MSNDKFIKFREQYKEFSYNGWALSCDNGDINIVFDFSIDGLARFTPSIRIPTENLEIVNGFDSPIAEKIIFNLGMVELISYWKCACPKIVNVKCGYLSEKDIRWFKKLYFGGLSEFFYINGIKTDEESFMQIKVNESLKPSAEPQSYTDKGINLIAIGGGKDSCVTTSLLKDFKEKNRFFTVNDQQARTDTVLAAGYSEKDIVKTYRTIDKNLLSLNSEGYLNGHTPFSAIVAFLSLYCAYLIGGKYIVLSNESSANESNIEGENVNHQYSKSYEFEDDFTAYVQKNIFGYDGIEYFSLLRPFSELQIAKMFASLEEYHTTFRSCNRGSKKNVWCGKCAKCLFVFTILSAFVDYGKLVGIFGNDMLNDEDCVADFDGLAGITQVKPFECVGTKDEFNFALWKLCEKLEKDGKPLPLLCERFKEKVDGSTIDKNLLKEYNALNNVPDEFLYIITEMYGYVAENN